MMTMRAGLRTYLIDVFSSDIRLIERRIIDAGLDPVARRILKAQLILMKLSRWLVRRVRAV